MRFFELPDLVGTLERIDSLIVFPLVFFFKRVGLTVFLLNRKITGNLLETVNNRKFSLRTVRIYKKPQTCKFI
jgi:hypothetical protein